MPRNPIQLLDGAVDALIDRSTQAINDFVERTPVAEAYNNFRRRAPSLSERRLDTPLGRIRTPEISLPDVKKVQIVGTRREALKAAIAIDASSVIGIIPVVGDILADVVEDTYGAKLRNSLSTQEMDWYTRYDKAGPSTLAALRTFGRSGMQRDNTA